MKIFKLTFITVLLIIMALGYAFTADVAQAETMDITATVDGQCFIATVPSLSLPYLSLGPRVTQDDIITTNCTAGTDYIITLQPYTTYLLGPDEGGLDFEVYDDAGCTTTWATGGTGAIFGTGSEDHPICIGIPADQNVEPGTYDGTIEIIVSIDGGG